MVTTQNGLIGRLARILVDLGSCFVVERVPIPLRLTVDLTAQDWDDLYKAPSVTLWTAQVKREDSRAVYTVSSYLSALYIFFCSLLFLD